jgi:mannose-6-phosphate isomerase-like protein (cupin superfamily)
VRAGGAVPDRAYEFLLTMLQSVGGNSYRTAHNPVAREVVHTNEVLVVKSGRVRVDFYTEDQCYLESRILSSGDVILLAFGGHGFEMLEQSELIEVKQGPYSGDLDKSRFDANLPKHLLIKGQS